MNPIEEKYYLEVNGRITKKLTEIPEVSQSIEENSQAVDETMNEISGSIADIFNGIT